MKKLRNNCSGQVLILSAMAIAFIIISTIVYVYTTSQPLPSADDSYEAAAFIRNVKLGSRNMMIGCLANISHGGSPSVLEANLERWRNFVEELYYLGGCDFNFTLCEDGPYSSGVWISWGTSGSGVTSAKSDFLMNLTDRNVEVTVDYSINITTSISVSAVSKWQSGYQEINVTIHVENEGEPALAKNITVYYQTKFGDWRDAGLLEDYLLEDFGNGTYIGHFTVFAPRVDNSGIMVKCYDRREIYVQASTNAVDI